MQKMWEQIPLITDDGEDSMSRPVSYTHLSAEDIMKEFQLEPGKKLGKLKKMAIDLADKNLYITKDEILEELRKIVDSVQVKVSQTLRNYKRHIKVSQNHYYKGGE